MKYYEFRLQFNTQQRMVLKVNKHGFTYDTNRTNSTEQSPSWEATLFLFCLCLIIKIRDYN